MKSVYFSPHRLLFFASVLFASSSVAIAQTEAEIAQITAHYDKTLLKNKANELAKKSKAEREYAIRYATERNIPVTRITEKGETMKLQKVSEDGTLHYFITYNEDASRATRTNRLHIGHSDGFDLDGQGLTVCVWDAGHARATHQEYDGPGGENRVTIMDPPVDLHSHGAHVIGTIASYGHRAAAKGMAPRAQVKSYQWDDDIAEATAEALNGMLVSNHSYGSWIEPQDSWYFGAYVDGSRDWDELQYNAPYYLMVTAAGNIGDAPWLNESPLEYGYDLLSVYNCAKNNLVVAALEDYQVDSSGNLNWAEEANFSSTGPTDDLRIKPDITGKGVGLFSTVENADNAYNYATGTSMASPNVAGSIILLQEHYNKINNRFMRAATLKGLVLHTADDEGPEGPDAKWGWGVLNMKRAAETISNNKTSTIIRELTINPGQTHFIEVESDGINDLIASISWTDLPGETVRDSINSAAPKLINDLDIRLTQNSETFYPWRLTSASTNSRDGDNNVDPFERIDIENASGTYSLTITHKGTLANGSQDFTLIVTGVKEGTINVNNPDSNDFGYYPNPVNDVLYLSSSLAIENLTVYNLLGQQILNKINVVDKKIDLSPLTSGAFLVKVIFEEGKTEIFKIIKK